MRTVHKFPLELIDRDQYHYRLPADAKILHVGAQDGLPTVWAEVDTFSTADYGEPFQVFGTGHAIPDGYDHVGTCQIEQFVWHVYRRAGQP